MDAMAEIRQTFFEECAEQLAELEAGLLAIENGEADSDTPGDPEGEGAIGSARVDDAANAAASSPTAGGPSGLPI